MRFKDEAETSHGGPQEAAQLRHVQEAFPQTRSFIAAHSESLLPRDKDFSQSHCVNKTREEAPGGAANTGCFESG